MWKSFRMWRRAVYSRKARSVREALQKQLFLLNPVFRDALLKIRKSCRWVGGGATGV